MPCKSDTLKPSQFKKDHFRQLVDLSPVAAGIQFDGEIIYMNRTGLALFGAEDVEQVLGKRLIHFFPTEHHDTVNRHFQCLLKEDEPFPPLETKLTSVHGKSINVELSAARLMIDKRPAIQFLLYVITKRKKLEEMLFQSKHDWENTFHTITDIITLHDKDFNIVYANKAAQRILNLPSSFEATITKCFKYYHGSKCAPEGCPSCDCLKTGEPANFEIFEPHLNMYIEIRAMPRFDRDNNLVGLIHIARDITDRKKTEEEIRRAKDELESRIEERTWELKRANEQLKEKIGERKIAVELLRKSESKYRNLSKEFHTLLNCIPDNLLLLSPDLKIMWANKAAASAFNSNESQLPGQYCYSLCCNVFSPCENCPTLKSFISGIEETAEITTATGKIWDIRAFPIKDDSGKVKNVIELARDITEKTNLQAGAMRSRHLASLGELAAGVAHEINNPINNIINYAQILIDEFEPENRDTDIPMRISKDGDRIATIVRSLLSFARIRKEEKSHVYLHEIFADTLSLTSAQVRKDGIHLKVHIPAKAIKVPVHSQQIQQVFLNIISNARYALNQKYPGTHENKILEISCEKIVTASVPYVRIVFHDRGIGIPSNIIDKVINPFFSTKPNRIGTGLGLSISHGIINEHEGKLVINSIEGEFTKIMIDLPTGIAKGEE